MEIVSSFSGELKEHIIKAMEECEITYLIDDFSYHTPAFNLLVSGNNLKIAREVCMKVELNYWKIARNETTNN